MRTLLVFFLVLQSSAAFAQGRAEKYEYEVSWGYADVARVTLQRGCTRDGYRPARLTAKSLGVAEQLHAFEIKLDSFLGPDGRTLEGRTYIKEQGVPRNYRTRFEVDGQVLAHKHFQKMDSTLKLSLRPGTYDMLSWTFALRQEKLTVGAKFTYYLWDGWKLTRVNARVGKLERIWTPRGTFDAHRIRLSRVRLHHAGPRSYSPKAPVEKLGTIWLRDDASKTPVAMDFGAPVGVAKLRLARKSVAACR